MESDDRYQELRKIAQEIESATQLEGLRPSFYGLEKLLQTYPADAQLQSTACQLKDRLVARGKLLAQQPAGPPPPAAPVTPYSPPVSPSAGMQAPQPPPVAPAGPAPSAPPPLQIQPSTPPPVPVVLQPRKSKWIAAVGALAALVVLAVVYVGVRMNYMSALSSQVASTPTVQTPPTPQTANGAPAPQASAPAAPAALPPDSHPSPPPVASATPSQVAPVPAASMAPASAPTAPPASANDRVHVQRYPSLEAPDTVSSTQSFGLQVSLTMEPLSRGVQVVAGPDSSVDGEGRLSMPLPNRGGQPWNIGVVLNAPDFEIVGGNNQSTIQLPPDGDSTPALFQLKPKLSRSPQVPGRISATFWHEGAYLARATRMITIVTNDRPGAITAASAVNRAGANAVSNALISASETAPDLTVYVQESRTRDRTTCQLTIESPYLQPASAECIPGDTIRPWLAEQYSAVLRAAQAFRGVRVPGGGGPAADKEQVTAMLRGLGQELYRRAGGPLFGDAFWKLVDREKGGDFHFHTIQIYTNNPVIPWELMVPVRGSTARNTCLGAEFDVARWHINDEVSAHDKPPSQVPFERLDAIVPEYAGGMNLQHQAEEISALEKLRGFSRVRAQMSDVAALLRNQPNGIVHFAGHGVAASSAGQVANSAIELENNASLDSMSWRGMARTGGHHPLYFFNACDVGQARRVLNFVDGWAPTVLDGGAAGFLGGLWPLGDKGAAEFATQFYRGLSEALNSSGSARITELLAQSRRQFYATGDPTFLGYVFYGDVGLRLVRP